MNFSTPPGSPDKAGFNTLTHLASNSPTQFAPLTPVGRAVQSLSENLVDQAGVLVVGSLPQVQMAVTPGSVNSVKDPSNGKNNHIQLFPKGLTAYRGDNSFNPKSSRLYSAQFFTLEKDVAQSEYGELLLKFTLNIDINVLRLDRDAEGFHDWLKKTDEFNEADKAILYKNFGYPQAGSASNNAEANYRLRISQGDPDRLMLKIINTYAAATKQTIHGYYIDTMRTPTSDDFKAEGSVGTPFHAELAVFDGSVFGQPVMVANLSEDRIRDLNDDYKMKRLSNEVRQAKKSKPDLHN